MTNRVSNALTTHAAGIFALFIAISMTSCGGGKGQSEATPAGDAPAVSVRVSSLRHQVVQRGVEVTGTFFGDDETVIAARVKGPIIAVFKDLGDQVNPGESLAQIDRTEYELSRLQKEAALREALARIGLDALPTGEFDFAALPAVQRSQAEANNAQARFDRGKSLFEDDPPLISAQEFEGLQTALEVAQREVTVQKLAGRALLSVARSRDVDLAIADQQLRDTLIRAPVTEGVDRHYAVARRSVSVGEYVSEGSATFTLVDADPVKFRVAAPERFLGSVKVGQGVIVQVEAFPGDFAGKVTRISPSVDAASRTFEVEAEIPNADLRLKPGAFARGRIETHTDENVAFVPESAVVSFAGVKRVYSVKDGKAVEHRITTGITQDGLIEVIGGGIPEDASIVIDGAARLAPGAAVTLRTSDEPTN